MTSDKLVNKLSIAYVWHPRVRRKSHFLRLIAHVTHKFTSNALESGVNLHMICPIRCKFTSDLSQPDVNLRLTIACQT